jgi:protein TonB
MPCTLIRLAVALLTFGLGVTGTTLWIAYRTPEVSSKSEVKYVKTHPLPLPPLPTVEEPPPLPQIDEQPAPRNGLLVLVGLLNSKAISKPAPAYPSLAKATRVSGVVKVQVLVGEDGKVLWAQAISGHPLLQDAAVGAARGARFSPTLRCGVPVRVSGTLSYNFVLQ